MAPELPSILDVPAAMDQAVKSSRAAGRPIELHWPDPLPIAVVGPPSSGKTTMLRALTANGLVPAWRVRLVEYPGLRGAADLRSDTFRGLWQDPVGIVYVLPSRGLTDQDEQALEMLRSRSLVVLENIRDSELHPARSTVELAERPDIGCPFTIPVVPLAGAGHDAVTPPAEQELLRCCLAYLRHATMPDGLLATLHRQAMSARKALRGDIDDQWRQVHVRAAGPDQLQRLDAARLLLSLRDDCAISGPYDVGLTELIRLAERGSAISPPLALRQLRGQAQAAADRYNIEAGRRPLPAGGKKRQARAYANSGAGDGNSTNFGAEYVRERQQLAGFLSNIHAQRAGLGLIDADAAAISKLADQVNDDKVDIALLGMFSSGKSSVINALLDVPVNDRDPALLPTNVQPETATVNRVCDSKDDVTINWLEQAELTFATPISDNPGQLRLHVDEIKAFRGWIASRKIRLRDVTFTPLPEEFDEPGGVMRRSPADPMAAFDRVWRELRFDGQPPKYVYAASDPREPKLPDPCFPAAATLGAMPSHHGLLPAGISRARIFAEVRKDPGLALMIDRLNIGFGRELLRHASFIDTPGTDAPIPHHRRVAHEIIRQQNCPVIYCFLGTQPAASEDSHNLKVLQDWGIGSTDLRRFFFVITMKGQVAEDRRPEVAEYVRKKLREIGIAEPTLYFVDVVKSPDDEEFRRLKTDVQAFIRRSRSQLFQSWLDHAAAILKGSRSRSAGQLDAMAESDSDRASRAAGLKRKLEELDALTDEFGQSPGWGAPWARHHVSSAIDARADRVDEVIDGLTSRRAFEGAGSRLSDALVGLNRATRSAVTRAHEGMLGKLQSRVAEISQGTPIQVSAPVIDDDPFPSTSILHAARNPQWRNVFKRLWRRLTSGEEMNADVANNREDVASEWRRSQRNGKSGTNSLVEASISGIAAELNRIRAGVEAEIGGLDQSPDPTKKQRLERACALADEWLARLDALGRSYGSQKKGNQ